MDTLGISTPYKARKCSQCHRDTEFYCHPCKNDLCLHCERRHAIDLDTKHHDTVIYHEKFENLPKQKPTSLYDARKKQEGNEQLKLTSTPVLHASFSVKDVSHVLHISGVTSDGVWVSDFNNLILTDTTGDTIHRVPDITSWFKGGGLHTVNSYGELIYINSNGNIKKLSIDNKTVTTLLKRPSSWGSWCVYCSPSTGDLMVGMCNYDTGTGKIARYNSTGQHVLTIQRDNTGHALYSDPNYITENKNGDIIVSDWIGYRRGAVVVTDRGGIYRFSYTGPPSGLSLQPRGICTDALSHILVCDRNTYTVQMIDKDGHFLSLLLTRQQHGIDTPFSLKYDDQTHLLWVGSLYTNTVSVYKYLQRSYSLTGKSIKNLSPITEKLKTFSKQMEQLRENGEADIRISLLVDSLDLEIKPSHLRRHQRKSKGYREISYNLAHLDCVGLDLMDGGTQDITIKSSIKPFSDSNVQAFLEWMKDCKKVLAKTRSTKQGSIFSVLFAVYTKEAILEFKEKDLVEIVDYSIRCAIESDNCILVSELVRTYLFDRDIQLQRILEDIKRISPAIIDTILQTVRNLILRKFRNLQNNGILLSFCWDCGEDNRLAMVMSYRGKIEMSDRIPHEVLGFNLVLYNFTQPPEEASSVLKSVPISKANPLPTVTESEARDLFRKHSNLTMISASPYKSMGYSKGKHIIVEKPCICLFCFHKGYIPYGEERFPKMYGEFEVDVQEGYCVLGSGASLEIGGYICRSGCGSIGGFVDLPSNKTGLITCAHVIFSSKELEELESMNGFPPGIEVKAFDRTTHTYRVCGTCTAAEFPKCFQQATSPHPNVDAVLIELNPAINTFRLRTVSSDQLYSAGFDPDSPPYFSGDVVPLSDPDPVHRICERIPDKLDSVVKYGVETGLTIGHLYHSGVHIRFISDSLKLPDNSRSAIMCDQIEIQNFPQGQFFECGDSGSFVFCINPDKTLSCLGMAVGLSLPQKSCLVTPIDRILRSVCPPGARLKPCSSLTQQTNAPPQATLDMILSAIGTFQASLQSVQTSLQSVQTNFQTSLKSVETNFQASLQNVERNVEKNFQASLQNVERNVEKNFQASLQNTETNFQAALQNVERDVEKNFQASLQNTEKNFQASLLNLQTEVRTLKSQAEQTEDSKTQSQSNSSVNNN